MRNTLENINLKNKSDKFLAKKKYQLVKMFANREDTYYKFEEFAYELNNEINRRNRSKIFKACCSCLKLRGWKNQFEYASHFAKCALDDPDYFEGNETYEIGGYYTKSGNPVLVDLVAYAY